MHENRGTGRDNDLQRAREPAQSRGGRAGRRVRHLGVDDNCAIYSRSVLGVGTRDVTSGYRCYTRQLLEQLNLDSIEAQGYSFQIEMAYRCARLGVPLVELPIRFEDRMAGKSKVSAGDTYKALLTVVRLRLHQPHL